MSSALVLAGGPSDEVSALQPGVPNKAFVRIAGVALVERTLRALRDCERIDRIVVVAPSAAHGDPALALADECRLDGPRITDSLAAGLAGHAPDEQLIVSAADLPILDGIAVADFIERVSERELDIAYGCVDRRAHVGRYAPVRHTWARLRDGTFCGAGIAALRPRAFASLARFLEDLGRSRKNPLALASLLGWDVLLRFAFGALSIAAVEARASRLLNLRAGAVVSPFPQIAVNVDRPSDVALAEALLSP
ncbi:MAG TPA: nucleotidyltransferase family protein [Magnetospirillaceae bacterium]|nr:nucleotidyltransferase family protein [Magnetospirillaceae bacterium]HXP93452.1 nucleotidyltransferase family protein [Candidatus Binatia bacterium]